MNIEAMAEARERAQIALSRARLSNDFGVRMQWIELAEAWLARLAKLERERPRHLKPRLVA